MDILAQRLPSVPEKAPEAPKKQSPGVAVANPQVTSDKGKTQVTGVNPKPIESGATAGAVHDATTIAGRRDAVTAAKPGNGDPKIKSAGIKSAGSPSIKPATEQKPVPQPMKISEKSTKPAASAPKPAPNQAGPEQPAPSQPATPPQDQTVPQENKPQ